MKKIKEKKKYVGNLVHNEAKNAINRKECFYFAKEKKNILTNFRKLNAFFSVICNINTCFDLQPK